MYMNHWRPHKTFAETLRNKNEEDEGLLQKCPSVNK